MGIRSGLIDTLEQELTDAKAAIKEAEKVILFRTGQIDRLNVALTAVKEALTVEDDNKVGGKKPKGRVKSSLPRLGNDFWLGLITDKRQKTGEILDAACAKHSITSEEDKAVMKNRMNTALKALHDAKSIASEGEQQKRVYFLPKPPKA